MTRTTTLGAFAAALAATFGAAALTGAAIGPEPEGDEPSAPHADDSHATAATATAEAPDDVRGLAAADEGLRLVIAQPELPAGRDETLAFRVVTDDGRTVRDFDVEHTKRMHVIVVRRDLEGFQHLHPTQAADGTWRTGIRLPAPGSYRVFADFSRDGTAATLASDLRVDGDADLRPLPDPRSRTVSDGGDDVRLDAAPSAPDATSRLRFTVSREGRAAALEEHLGAGGHLVALREGDLAFLHVHPETHGGGDHDAAPHGGEVAFETTFPTPGRYRLFLQYSHEGRVHTAAFTREVTDR